MALSKPVIIGIYQKKGGVGKTTHSANIAATLASKGYKVLFVDADSQVDSTKLLHYNKIRRSTTTFDGYQAYLNEGLTEQEIQDKVPRTLHEAIEAVRLNLRDGILAAKSKHCFSWQNGGAMWLLPGHPKLSGWDDEIAFAFSNLDKPHYRQYPGAIYTAICKAAENLKLGDKTEKADFVVVDISAHPGSLNGCLYMSCDFTIMPIVPDNLTVNDSTETFETVINWFQRAKIYIERANVPDNPYHFPTKLPKFLGYVIGKYDICGVTKKGTHRGRGKMGPDRVVRDDAVAKNVRFLFKEADDRVNLAVPVLRALNPPLALPDQKDYCLAQIRTFNQCGQLSQLIGIPVCFLSKDDMAKYNEDGNIEKMTPLEGLKYLEIIKSFRDIYDGFVDNILDLIISSGVVLPARYKSQPLVTYPDYVLKTRAKFITKDKNPSRSKRPAVSIDEESGDTESKEDVNPGSTRQDPEEDSGDFDERTFIQKRRPSLVIQTKKRRVSDK